MYLVLNTLDTSVNRSDRYVCIGAPLGMSPCFLHNYTHTCNFTLINVNNAYNVFTNDGNSCFVSYATINVCPSSRTSVVKDAWSYSKNFHNNPIEKPDAKCIYQTLTDMVYTLIARRGILVQ